jgi:hypothetical protein
MSRFVNEKNDKRNHNADQNAGSDWEIQLEISPIDHNIARESSREGKLRAKLEDCTDYDHYNARYYEDFAHLKLFISAAACVTMENFF